MTLQQYLSHPEDIPQAGLITRFRDVDELTEHWDELARGRMIRRLCGGSPFPRKLMLEIVPPGKGQSHWDEDAIRRSLSEWEEASRRFPVKWLKIMKADEGEGGAFSPREADLLAEQLTRTGLAPVLLGDLLRRGEDTLLLTDGRAESEVASNLAKNGLVGRAERFRPAECAEATRISVGSPRLDAVVSRACCIGRGEAKKAVVRGFVALNMRLARDPSSQVAVGDVLQHLLQGALRVDDLAAGRRRGRHSLTCRIANSVRLQTRG
jgi:RNA-binding protein YlmH